MKIKNLLVKILLNKRQREVIYKALVFSAYKYRKHGNVDKAVSVQTVINEVSGKLGIVPETFTKDEVDNIVNNIFSNCHKQNQNAFFAGIQEGKKRAFKEFSENKSGLAVGAVIDFNKCNNCDHKETCFIKQAIAEAEAENNTPEKNNEQPQQDNVEAEVVDESNKE